MRSASRIAGRTVLLCLWLAFPSSAMAATPVGKVLKKVQENARRGDKPQKPPAKTETEPAPKRPVQVTISKETTYITSPLRPDGYPDYVAALDAIAARGVTPENNAVVLLVQAFGPKAIREKYRERYFEKLGIRPLPEKGDYMEPLMDRANRLHQRDEEPATDDKDDEKKPDLIDRHLDELDRAMERPWSEKDCPLIAAWLKASEKPLHLIIQGSRRPRYYSPRLGPSMVAILLPDIEHARDATRALRARAMLRLHSGNVEGACADLLACHRLARLVGQGPTMVDMLVAGALEAIAYFGDRAAMHFGNVAPEQIRRYTAEVRTLGPMPRFAEKLEPAERFIYLDTICLTARGGWGLVRAMSGADFSLPDDGPLEAFKRWALSGRRNWDDVLRTGNAYYDRFSVAARKRPYGARKAALKQIEAEISSIRKEVGERRPPLVELLRADPLYAATSEQLGAALVGLMFEGNRAIAMFEYRTETGRQLTDIALPLALYRAERGAYPDRLEQLVPKYLPAVPKDCYSDAAIRYKREGTGYLLYSLGPNGKDDGGRGRHMDPPPDEDEKLEEDADDIGFRMPALPR
jgi:hypothetical protein